MADDIMQNPQTNSEEGNNESISFDEFLPEEEAPFAIPSDDENEGSREKIEKWKSRGEKVEKRLRGETKKPTGGGEEILEGPTKGPVGAGERAVAEGGERAAARGVAEGAGRAAVGAGGRAVAGTAVRAGATVAVEAGGTALAGAVEGAVAGSVVPGAGTAIGAGVGIAVGVADAASSTLFGIIKGQYKPIDLAEFVFITLICLTVDIVSSFLYVVVIGFLLSPIIRMLCLAVLGGFFLFRGSSKPLGIMRALVKFLAVTIVPMTFVFPLGLFIPILTLIFTAEVILHNKLIGSVWLGGKGGFGGRGAEISKTNEATKKV